MSRLGSEPLETIKDRFGFQIASEDYRDVIDAEIDICVVSSPTALHYEHAKAALEAGASVLVEKPVTIRPDEAWDLAGYGRARRASPPVRVRLELPTAASRDQGVARDRGTSARSSTSPFGWRRSRASCSPTAAPIPRLRRRGSRSRRPGPTQRSPAEATRKRSSRTRSARRSG